MRFSLPSLFYSPAALEPVIDEMTMRVHHSRLHCGHVARLNEALADGHDSTNLHDLLRNLNRLPPTCRETVRRHGGGHFNHTLLWQTLAPFRRGGSPHARLRTALDRAFGGGESFKNAFADCAARRFGSGWAWLCADDGGELFVCTTPEEDNPLMEGLVERPGTPVFGLDLWEHAYYLGYRNRRLAYVSGIWDVVDWRAVSAHYDQAMARR